VLFLLPGAERNRKKLLTVFAVVALCVQACFPLPLIDNAVHTVFGPLMRPITRLAGVYSSFFQRLPTADVNRKQYTSPLIAAERKRGHPQEVPGVVWLEVPVLDIDVASGRMKLGAGDNFYLSPGMIVAFGKSFLGRIAAVEPEIALVDLYNRAGQRTGLTLKTVDSSTRAVCFGRGFSGPAVIDWLEDEKQAFSDAQLLWRPRPLDAAQLANAGLHLGVSRAEGSFARGNHGFVVEHKIPASAEGRVYVAASAIGESVVTEPVVRQAPAQRILLGGGVFGGTVCAVSASCDFRPAVLSDHSRVCGSIVEWRQNWGWTSLLTPSAWDNKAVFLNDGQVQLFDPSSALQHELYTRGGVGVPRGLFLGKSHNKLFAPSVNLDVWLAPQSVEVMHQ
jgi:hypothetical protein